MQARSQSPRFCAFLVSALLGLCAAQASAGSPQPISTIGHGGFFDADGNQVTLTQDFVIEAQAWYRADMLSRLDADKTFDLASFEADLFDGVPSKGQTRLLFEQRALEWLYDNSTRDPGDYRTLGKLRAMDYALTFRLPERLEGKGVPQGDPFVLEPRLAKKLAAIRARQAEGKTPTVNQGAAYIAECIAASVPIPPTINQMDPNGTAGWKSQGFIPQALQFIVGTPAELRSYKSSSPLGMCYALPRYTNNAMTTVGLDGVICLSQVTSKVCIWDNQMAQVGFPFPAGQQIPIGVPNLGIDPVGRYQAGGNELLNGSGGICTDCHAGENPYITHPDANLGPAIWSSLRLPPQNLPTISPWRYDPLVPAAWPQNQLSQAAPNVLGACNGCHKKLTAGGTAGRFPHLSNQLVDYCGTILPQALVKTMPQGSPNTMVAAGTTWKNTYCSLPPNAASGDAGDPHITTTNGVNYDFQAAGEFTVLKNSDSEFEVQARQTPVQTNFTPGPNPYTGLASCVSLNTAVAARIGGHRVSYQPLRSSANREEMVLRIDGTQVPLTATPINLGGGIDVVRASFPGAGLFAHSDDGTDLTVTPRYWSSQGYWYLDIDALNTPAREGVAGHIHSGDWLPRSPTGASFGPMPGPLTSRHVLLNQTFADAWRVSSSTSLFDYATGTNTGTFTDRNWPTPPGQPCLTPLPPVRAPIEVMQPQLALQVCRPVRDDQRRANCVFDVTVLGDAIFAEGYLNPVGGGTAAANPGQAKSD